MMMRFVLALALTLAAVNAFKWDSCGTKLDRLKTDKVTESGSIAAGSKVTVTASGTTDLHAPLESGAWQVRVYETGVPKETHTEVGDLMKALKFTDAKNTTFSMTVTFTLPAKKASGEFNANIVATDQAKSDYLCLDFKYSFSAVESFDMVGGVAHCTKDDQCPSSYCQNGMCHACGDACCETDKDCPGSYCANDPTKMPPYTCHGGQNLFALVHGWAANTVPRASGYVHQEITSPGDHCLEIMFPGAKGSPFWKSDGWKYGAPVRPEWKDGACNKTKWTSVDQKMQDYDGWTKDKNSPYGSVIYTKYGYDDMVSPIDDAVEDKTVNGTSVYCMNDPSKTAPFYCHCPPLPTTCKTDKDCTTPWYSSYCMNDASKKAPYECKLELPPTCKTDKDCAR
jgi:hypothetical protein